MRVPDLRGRGYAQGKRDTVVGPRGRDAPIEGPPVDPDCLPMASWCFAKCKACPPTGEPGGRNALGSGSENGIVMRLQGQVRRVQIFACTDDGKPTKDWSGHPRRLTPS